MHQSLRRQSSAGAPGFSAGWSRASWCGALVSALLLSAGAAFAARGPSTPEERKKAVELVELLETAPASPDAAAARQWLTTFVSEVPDLTVKQCMSLIAPAADRAAIRPELMSQHIFSGAGYLLRNPGTAAGGTDTLTAALVGTVRAYRAWKQADASVAHPRLEQLAELEANGQLETYVRAAGRNCR
jgi:hypothetical protein